MTPTTMPLPRTEPHGNRRGFDRTLLALVRPAAPAGVEHESLPELRASCDTHVPRDPDVWSQAMSFLRELDSLDRQYVSGELSPDSYLHTLEERHQAAPLEVWMLAVQLVRLADRLMRVRHTRQGTDRDRPTEGSERTVGCGQLRQS